ncbi:hypothetical protein [Bradyrhizobium sp. USDA 3364]
MKNGKLKRAIIRVAARDDARLAIAVVDTRGVDGSAVRPDILAHLEYECAVNFCSKWGSAPDPSGQNPLTHVSQSNADSSLLDRVAIVALARAADALSMRHHSGESAEDALQGYDIKLGHVEDALQTIGIPGVNIFACDETRPA